MNTVNRDNIERVGKHVITDIIEDGPAEDAGLKVGDEIASKGQTINGESIDAISKYIKGASGTEVELGVRKLGEENIQQSP